MKNHLNILRFKTIEKRSEEYNKFLIKRFFKELKKNEFKDNPLFLRLIYDQFFTSLFEKGDFCEAFSCDDIFDEKLSQRCLNQNQRHSRSQKTQLEFHSQNPQKQLL